MKFSALMLCSLLLVSSCGKKVSHSDKEVSLSKVESQLNAGEYENAIKVLEDLRAKNPDDQVVGLKLLHAYAGAGSFEALKVVSIGKEIEELLKEFKETNKEEAKAKIQDQAAGLLAKIEKALEPIPTLTSKQKERLDQAIALYSEIGMTLETAGKYNNFKWGTLHVWRLAITFKEMVKEVRAENTEEFDLKKIEKIVMPRMSSIGQDLFKSYQLYAHSFNKIKKFTDSVDKLIGKTINDKDFKLRVNTLAASESEFYESLIKDNMKVAGILVNKLSGIYRSEGYEAGLKEIAKKLPSEEEIKATEKRIETLVKVVIENFSKENPEIESKLKSIFTENLKKEIIEAAKLSIKEKNLKPLKDLLDLKQPEMEVIKGYYQILVNDVKESQLEENVRAEVDALRKKVDLEMLKAELKELTKNVKADTQVVQLGVDAALHQSEEKIEARKAQISGEIKSLEDYLDGLLKEVDGNLKAPNEDKEKMDTILNETKELVES